MKCVACNKKLTIWKDKDNNTIYDCFSAGGNCICRLVFNTELKIVQYCIDVKYKGITYTLSANEPHYKTQIGYDIKHLAYIDYVDFSLDEDIREKATTTVKRIINLLAFL